VVATTPEVVVPGYTHAPGTQTNCDATSSPGRIASGAGGEQTPGEARRPSYACKFNGVDISKSGPPQSWLRESFCVKLNEVQLNRKETESFTPLEYDWKHHAPFTSTRLTGESPHGCVTIKHQPVTGEVVNKVTVLEGRVDEGGVVTGEDEIGTVVTRAVD
jgi:hypothetical protein